MGNLLAKSTPSLQDDLQKQDILVTASDVIEQLTKNENFMQHLTFLKDLDAIVDKLYIYEQGPQDEDFETNISSKFGESIVLEINYFATKEKEIRKTFLRISCDNSEVVWESRDSRAFGSTGNFFSRLIISIQKLFPELVFDRLANSRQNLPETPMAQR